MLGAGKPAVDAANVPFGRPRPDLGREQGAHHRAGRRFGGQQIDATFATPFFVPFDRPNHSLRPHPGGFGGVHNGPGICQRTPVMDFELSGFRFLHRLVSFFGLQVACQAGIDSQLILEKGLHGLDVCIPYHRSGRR